MTDSKPDLIKAERFAWLARLFSDDKTAVLEEEVANHIVEFEHDFGLEQFVQSYRPLAKLHAANPDLSFVVRDIRHPDPDRSYAGLWAGGKLVFEIMARFEEEHPYRLKYWMPHPPLPEGVSIRPYRPSDAAACAALERLCPMEMKDGNVWVVDRGDAFHDYLCLMQRVDAAVVVADGAVVGFYSNALQPVRYKDENIYCVYQHHYRVHPDFRAGSVSQALAAAVDTRRSFEAFDIQFPYSYVDPENAHMQHMGFPPAPDVEIARLAIPLSAFSEFQGEVQQADLNTALKLINDTHRDRGLFIEYDRASFNERLSRISAYGPEQVYLVAGAVMGIWSAGERNVLQGSAERRELRMAFLLDYGFTSPDRLLSGLAAVAPELKRNGCDHVAVLCDTRSEEYDELQPVADDVQRLHVHTAALDN